MSNTRTTAYKKRLAYPVSPDSIGVRVSIGLIQGYRYFINPALKALLGVPRVCDQTPSCSAYAILALRQYGFFKGVLKALKRVASCQPLGKTLWK